MLLSSTASHYLYSISALAYRDHCCRYTLHPACLVPLALPRFANLDTSNEMTSPNQEAAPLYDLPFPLQTFTAIEYPGPVSTSAQSVSAALDAIGGLRHLSSTLAAEEPYKRVVELSLGGVGIDRLHPLQGEVVSTQNIVLKITKRRRKGVDRGEASVTLPGEKQGVYTASVVGVVDKTVRFRCMSLFFCLCVCSDTLWQLWRTFSLFRIRMILFCNSLNVCVKWIVSLSLCCLVTCIAR